MDNLASGEWVVLSLGSNCGDRAKAVAEAINWLSGLLEDFEASSIYETPPVGHSGPYYMNAVATGRWHRSLENLDFLCKEYEISHGRDLKARERNEVPVDIDIVMASDRILRPKDYRCDFFRIGLRQLERKQYSRESVV